MRAVFLATIWAMHWFSAGRSGSRSAAAALLCECLHDEDTKDS